MPVLESLTRPPFSLAPIDVAWVQKTLNGMSAEDKVRQLFVHMAMGDDLATIDGLLAKQPGGIHRNMGGNLEATWKAAATAPSP